MVGEKENEQRIS